MSASNKIIQAAAGNAAGEALYVEDVFSTYLYEGNGTTQTITNGIDLDGEGGLVWNKDRSGAGAAASHTLVDTDGGPRQTLFAQVANGYSDRSSVTAFNSDGFTLGNYAFSNQNGADIVTWTFRKAPKFFDVVSYSGTGSARTVSHNLGSVPGCIIVKRTDTSGDWQVYHRSNTANPETDYLVLNSGAATVDSNTRWNDTAPTDSVFTVGTEATVNASGGTYVAYLFAHNDGDGEFGEGADQDIIKCGSYVGNGTTPPPSIDLGFEPQFVLIKCASAGYAWRIFDVMRGIPTGGLDPYLEVSTADEAENYDWLDVTSTGFNITRNNVTINASGETFIYIAIRRGPMKTPESGTEVFAVDVTATSSGANTVNVGFVPDHVWHKKRTATAEGLNSSRIIGSRYLDLASTAAELEGFFYWDNNTNFFGQGMTSASRVGYFFSRAPGFFDVVAYEGDGTSGRGIAHNLGVAPEMMVVKKRNASRVWTIYHSGIGSENYLQFDNGASASAISVWNETDPASTEFTVGASASVNTSGDTYIAYLFATLPGVSKVGSYTGNGTSQTIDCGFSTGARFVLIKRTDSTGDWHVYDSERGIVAGNDPRLELNTGDGEDTGSDDIDPVSSGFSVTSNADVNTNTAEYIFLAIA